MTCIIEEQIVFYELRASYGVCGSYLCYILLVPLLQTRQEFCTREMRFFNVIFDSFEIF